MLKGGQEKKLCLAKPKINDLSVNASTKKYKYNSDKKY